MIIEKDNYPYKFDATVCSNCDGNCCIGESGYIWISKKEIENLALFLNISIEELGIKYLLKVGYKYSLKEKKISNNNYACIFFDLKQKKCSIYDVRPNQCRTFPFWEYFKNNVKEVQQECPAIILN